MFTRSYIPNAEIRKGRVRFETSFDIFAFAVLQLPELFRPASDQQSRRIVRVTRAVVGIDPDVVGYSKDVVFRISTMKAADPGSNRLKQSTVYMSSTKSPQRTPGKALMAVLCSNVAPSPTHARRRLKVRVQVELPIDSFVG